MTCPLQSEIGRRGTSVAIIRRLAMARYRPDAFPSCRPWQDCALMHSQAAGHDEISPRCVPEGASDGKNTGSRQHIACMYSNTANFGKICVPCIQKAPQSAVGECTARASCRQGALSPSEALKSCTAHESCHPPMDLPLRRGSCPSNCIAGSSFNGLALAQGGGAYPPSASPIPATSYTPLALQTQPNTSSWARWLLPKKRNRARQRIKVWKRQLGFRYKQRLAFEGCVMPSTRRIG